MELASACDGAGAVTGAESQRQRLNSSKRDLCSTIALIFLLRSLVCKRVLGPVSLCRALRLPLAGFPR